MSGGNAFSNPARTMVLLAGLVAVVGCKNLGPGAIRAANQHRNAR